MTRKPRVRRVSTATVVASVLGASGAFAFLPTAAHAADGSDTVLYSDGHGATKTLPLVEVGQVGDSGDTTGTSGSPTANPPGVYYNDGGSAPLTTQNGNTCDYFPANIIGWNLSNDATHYGTADTNPIRSDYHETGVASSSDDGYSNDSGDAHALISVGTQVPMGNNMPSGTTITMKYPWHIFGNLYAHSAYSPLKFLAGFSSGSASYTLTIQAWQNSLEGESQVASDGLSANSGVDNARDIRRNYSDNGGSSPSMTVSAPAGSLMTSYLHINMYASDQATYGAYGQGETRFAPGGSTYYFGLSHARWIYNLPSGWALTSCGG